MNEFVVTEENKGMRKRITRNEDQVNSVKGLFSGGLQSRKEWDGQDSSAI